VQFFGLSKITLRLPAVIGGILYATGCARLTTRHLGSAKWGWTTLTLLTLNPFVVDFLVASRGYALALAFLIWHIDELLRGHTTRASLLAGLAVSANLTFLVGVAATSLARLLLDRTRVVSTGVRMALPAIAVFAIICGATIVHAQASDFFVGTATLIETANELANVSFRHGVRNWLPLALPAIAIAVVCAIVAATKHGAPLSRFFGLALVLCIIVLAAANLVGGVRYPAARTGLYLVVLGTLFFASGAAAIGRNIFIVPLMAIVAVYAAQFEGSYFRAWRYDAATERMFDTMREISPRGRICADWIYEPTLNFYRILRHAGTFDPIKRDVNDRCDFVLINTREDFIGARQHFIGLHNDPFFSQNRFVEISRDELSGSVLYAKERR
jgi:hypothetical protein